MINSIKILFFSVMLMSLQPIYADVVIGNGNIERLNSGVVKDINCQNYTILLGGLLDTSNGGILREVTNLEINGEWKFGAGQIQELGAWVNNGTVSVKPTQGVGQNLLFTTLCGPISVLGTSDTDGDGISDADEGDNAVALGHGITLDQDNDGTYNFLDNDSDGDGLTDSVEGGNNIDTDGDGIPDYLDNNDSRPNSNDDSKITGNNIGDDVEIDILDNDRLKDGSPVLVDDVNVTLIAPTGGTLNADGSVTVPGEGTWAYDATTGILTFSPLSGFTGNPTSIEYVITDVNTGLTSEPATVNVEYDAAAMAPVADDDSSAGNNIGVDVNIDILDGDTLGNGAGATPSDVNITLQVPVNGVLNTDGSVTVAGEGTWTYNSITGVLTFSPLNGFVGSPTPIRYMLKEISTGLTDTATVTVVYDVEIKAVDDGVITIAHYGANVIDVLINDEFSGNVMIKITTQPTYGTLEVVVESDGNSIILYSPFADINHVSDSFSYVIRDENNNTSEATVTLDVKCASSQTSDGADTLNSGMFLLMIVFTMLIGLYAIRREDERKEINN